MDLQQPNRTSRFAKAHSHKFHTLRKLGVLRKVGEHHILVSLVLDKNMASGLHNVTAQSAKRCYQGTVSKNFVAKGSAFVARVPDSSRAWVGLKLDKRVLSFENLQIVENTELHRSPGLLSAEAAMTPASQGRITSDLPFKVSAHARPSSSRHDESQKELTTNYGCR